MAKRIVDSDSWLSTLRQWLAEPHSMPLASLTHFAEDVIKMDIDIAREKDDEEEVGMLESALESLCNGDMSIGTIYSYASVGVLHEYDLVFETSLHDEQDDAAD